MKNFQRFLRAGIVILTLCLGTGTNAQLVQYPTSSTGGAFHWMLYDPYVEGRIIGAVDMFNDGELPSLYISEDNGTSWRLLFEFTDPIREEWENIKGTIMNLQFKKNRNTVYFQLDNTSSPYTCGLYSFNHQNREIKHYTLPNAEVGASLRSYDVYDENGDTVLLNTIYMQGTIPISDIFLTTDGGKNWEMIYHCPDYDYVTVGNVVFTPGNPKKIFMLRHGAQFGITGGVLISKDAGKTWKEQLSGRQWGPIAFNPTNPDEIYIGTHLNYMNLEETFLHSTDGGNTWKEVPLEYNDFILNNFTDIEYDPHDPNKIIVIEENQIFITDDNFKTYENLMPDDGNYMWGLYASINPFNTDEMWIGNDGHNVWHTLDRGRNLSNVGGARIGRDYISAGIGAGTSGSLLYFVNDAKVIGVNPRKNQIDFRLDTISVGGFFVDPANGNRLFLSDTSAKKLYFAVREEESTSLYPVNTFTEKSTIVAILPQGADQYMAAVNNKLYRIDVATPDNISFTEISIPGSGDVTALAATAGAIYFARGGKVYYSVDGNSWTERSTGLGTDVITALAVNMVDANKMLLSAGNKLYRSMDGGTSWTVALYGYRADILAYSADGTRAMAGAYTSTNENAYLLYSTDGGTNWNYVSADALQYANTESMAFEFGRTDTLVAHIASSDMGRLAYIIPLTCTETEISVYPRYYEDFEDGMPLCYTQEAVIGSTLWEPVKANEGTPANAPAGSEMKLGFKADAAAQTRLSLPLLVDLDTLENPMLSFAYVLPENATLNVYYRLTADGTWTELAVLPACTEWTSAQILLPVELEKAYVSIVATTTSVAEIYMDNLKVVSSKGLPCNPARDITAEVSYGFIRLNWIAPVDNYGAVYNLYRNNTLIAEKIDSTTYTDKNINAGMLTYTVKAFCRGSQTEGDSIEVVYTGTKNPARNLTIETHNGIDGNIIARLKWDAPETYTQNIYNIYRDNELIAEGIDNESYIDNGFIVEGEHEWCVATTYTGVEAEEKACARATCQNICAPVSDLKISYDIPQKEVNLHWEQPTALPKDWLTYSYEPKNALGIQETGTYKVVVAARWTAEELQAKGLDGAKITELAFVPATERASYTIRVWIGGDGTKPGNEKTAVYKQGHQINVNDWNTVVFNRPVEIDATQELWIGYEVKCTGGVDIIGCDAGPGKKGKNMVDLGNGWSTFEAAIESANYNLSIAAHIQKNESKATNVLAQTDEGVRYNVYRDGELLATTSETSFTEDGLAEDFYHYSVTVVHPNACESPAVGYDFFAGNTCAAVEELKVTTLPEGEVVLNWPDVDPYLSTEIRLHEGFEEGIPDTWIKKDKDGDGRNWMHSSEAGWYYPCKPYEGKGCAFSDIHPVDDALNTINLSPDNWLISPKVTLTTGMSTLRYHVSNLYRFSYHVYYEVLISTTGTEYADFSVIDSDTLEQTSADVWYEKTVDLSSYTGDVYIAFRNLNDSMDVAIGVQIDEVSIEEIVPIARTYNVYRDDEKIAGPLADTSYTDMNAPAGSHNWCVRAVCNELTYESNPICEEASVILATETMAEISSIWVYPNPANHKLTLEKTDGFIDEVKIFDLSGRCLRTWDGLHIDHMEIDFSLYRSGIYLLKIDGQLVKVVKE